MSTTPPTPSLPEPFRRQRVLEAWLQTEHLSKTERLDRLAGDAELEALLREDGFEGDDWDFFEHVLAEYGVAVINGWLRDRLIVKRCREKNVKAPSLPQSVTDDPEAREDIAGETVAEAINHFRDDVLLPGIWDPSKGAALKTFFIGQCLFRYPNVAHRWLRHDMSQDALSLEDEQNKALDTGRITGVEDDVIRTVMARAVLEGASNPRAARVLAMDACRYTNAEIAADLGTTVEAVKSILKRERARIRVTKTQDRAEGGQP